MMSFEYINTNYITVSLQPKKFYNVSHINSDYINLNLK